MEGTSTTEAGAAGDAPQQLLITGTGDQPLVMSAEDAAQFLQQAGIQWDAGSGQVIIGDVQAQGAEAAGDIAVNAEGDAVAAIAALGGRTVEAGDVLSNIDSEGASLSNVNDGTVLYIDPNDPQAAALLEQAGLTLTEDGTVQSIDQSALNVTEGGGELGGAADDDDDDDDDFGASSLPSVPVSGNVKSESDLVADSLMSIAGQAGTSLLSPAQAGVVLSEQLDLQPQVQASKQSTSASSIVVGPDQQQVFYSVTYEDGKAQQYMMLCPKDMDQNALIQTLVKQISADPTAKGKKTIRIQKPSGSGKQAAGLNSLNKSNPVPKFPTRIAEPRTRGRPTTSRQQSMATTNDKIGEVFANALPLDQITAAGLGRDVGNVVDSSEAFESVATQDLATGELITSPESGGTRVYVRCFYCSQFRSTLNSDTWEAILNHILPVCKEEIQTTFYGDLSKHFVRSVRLQVNGKQVVRSRTLSGTEKRTPQCEVILTHSLVCRKTKKEFIVSNPDAAFVANLAKHIRMIQPGQGSRGNSLLCIFCNSPFTYEDYLRHIQPHIDPILATLSCFAGAYCALSYETTTRATANCQTCQESEPADLRFLPCTKFSAEYRCLAKLQFAIECFRENYGDSGYMRLNTSNLAKCSVCKNPQAVYCAVFHITTNVLGGGAAGGTEDIDTTLSVCVNCQKQFINIVMKEQGFDEKLKVFQLRNMEQLCSCLRVILGQAKQVCSDKKVLLYTVDENATNQTSAVHTVRSAEVTQLAPVTKLLALPETEVLRAPVKAFFICDLCLFTVDLTSLIVPPGPSSSNAQKNDMLLSIVLEHLIPHTESLMTVVASSAANKTVNLKFEILSRVTDILNHPGGRKIVLSLQKKFKSQTSAMEVVIDKDEEKTMAQVRTGIKAERKQYVSIRPSTTTVMNNPSTPANATQLIDVNKFVEQQRGKLGILAQCGCNTTLLNAYAECRLCSKFCFPDFRLVGTPGIELCENCVETVLTLCLPSEPETLDLAEECLALKQDKTTGHRLVLASNVKKWLSVDGVSMIKRTVESFDQVKADCGTFFSDALKQHLVANLKTCQNDGDITSAVTGFCVTDSFFTSSKVHSEEAKADEETAAALASLSAQIGMQIKPVVGQPKPPGRQKQIEVKILSRRPVSDKRAAAPLQLQRLTAQRGFSPAATSKKVVANGVVIDLGSNGGSKKVISTPNRTIHLPSSTEAERDEESVTAIQNFLDATSAADNVKIAEDLKVPAGVKITSAGKGVVNIRAISDTTSKGALTTPKAGRVGRPLVSTSGSKTQTTSKSSTGETDASRVKASMSLSEWESEVEGETMKALEESLEKEALNVNGGGKSRQEQSSSRGARRPPVTTKEDEASASSDKEEPEKRAAAEVQNSPGSGEPRRKRQRKERKIFDL